MSENAQTVPHAPEAKVKPQQDADGRFAKGNSGGPGNPFGPRVADMRRAFLDAVTEEDMRAIAKALIKKATEGSVPAAKIVLAHVLGKPASYVPTLAPSEPELTAQDWEVIKQLLREGDFQNPLAPPNPPSPNGNLREQGRGNKNDPFPLPADLGNPANVSVASGKPPSRGK